MSVLCLLLPHASSGLSVAPASRFRAPVVRMIAPLTEFDPLNLHGEASYSSPAVLPSRSAILLGMAAVAAAQPEAAFAKGGEFGIFEGRIVSLAHPVVMGTMYAASAWSAFTGLQWRRLREVGGQITSLKADLAVPEGKLQALKEKDPDASDRALERQISELKTEIDSLTATRKELAGEGFRDKHYQVGSVVLGLGTAFAIEGPVNTFLRAQKLFPGPHLYAGAGVVVCWAMAASLVPLMSKGKDAARTAHIAFNVLALGLFTWQLPTGWDITLKVVKFTKFP